MAHYAIPFRQYASEPGAAKPFFVALGMTLLTVIYAAIFVLYQGDTAAIVIAVLPFAALFLMAKPMYGLYLSVAAAILVDEELTPWLKLHHSVSELSGHSLDWFILTPLEFMIFAALLGQIIQSVRSRQSSLKGGTFFKPMVPFLLFIVLGAITGLARGGNVNIALWEFRAIFYLPAVYLIFCNSVKHRAQLHTVMWIVLLCTAVDAFLGTWTYLVILGGNLGGLRAITDHQQAIFFDVLVLFALAYAIYKVPRPQGRFVLVVLPITLIALVAANRRAAFVTLAIGLIVMMALAFQDNKRTVLKAGLVMAIVFVPYAGVFWNSHSALAKPLQSIKSVNAPPGTADYASNIYRVMEKWNIVITVHHNPLLGVGYGKKFEMAIPLPFFKSPFREYITHNSVLWLWMKEGVFGFIAFLFFIGLALSRAARIFREVEDRQLKPLLAVGLTFVIMYMVYSYVDQGWDYKGMVYMGVVLGSFAVAKNVSLVASASRSEAS